MPGAGTGVHAPWEKVGRVGLNGPVATSASPAQAAWSRVRHNLRLSAGARLFDQWLKPIELVETGDPDMIRLTLPSAFMTNWVKSHYAERLLHEFRAIIPGVRSVAIETATTLAVVEVLTPGPVTADAPDAAAKPRPVLDTRFTFARFCVDASNRVAFNAAKALAEPGPPRFSPLFLHSATGNGKSHLMHAIGHAYLAAVPGAGVICMSAERFMFDFVAAMRAKDTHAFKARLRSVDLLLIDDLQFIAGKDATQEEFFHTVNEIMAAGKRIVISADRCPQALDGVEPRIVSRLAGRAGRRHQGAGAGVAQRGAGAAAGRASRDACAGRRAGDAVGADHRQHPRPGRLAQPPDRLFGADRRRDRHGIRGRDAWARCCAGRSGGSRSTRSRRRSRRIST